MFALILLDEHDDPDLIFVFNTGEQAKSYREYMIDVHSDGPYSLTEDDFYILDVTTPDPEWQDEGGEG